MGLFTTTLNRPLRNMKNKSVRLRLIVMNFLQFAIWGAYLTSMGNYLGKAGLAENIGWFYSMQGIVSIFMPALVGIIADKIMPAQKVLSLCHGIAGVTMLAAGYYGMTAGSSVEFGILFPLYSLSVAFFMPTIALSNSVAYTILEDNGYDTVKDFLHVVGGGGECYPFPGGSAPGVCAKVGEVPA